MNLRTSGKSWRSKWKNWCPESDTRSCGTSCDELDERAPILVFRLLPKELAAEVFVELDSDEQELLIRGFSNSELKEVLDELYLDDAVDIVEEMPAGVVKRILQHADPETRKSINEILKYPEDSTGSIMTTEFVDLQETMTVEDALKRIRRTGPDKETINVSYVIDDERRLIGLLSMTFWLCRWWTRRAAWWASSPWTTLWMCSRRRSPRTSRRWRPSSPATSPI